MWPADERGSIPARKGKHTKESEIADYPRVKFGASAALTLEKREGRFEWKSISQYAPERRLGSDGHVESFFPGTHPAPLRVSHTTIQQRAEQGANFLRSHFPEIEISAELIRSEIEEDEKWSRTTASYDPLAGNLITPVTCHGGGSNQSFLVFPSGPLNRDMNVTLLYDSLHTSSTTISPSSEAQRHFQTPIQQIVTSDDHNTPLLPSNITTDAYIAARTMGSCTIMHASNFADAGVIEHSATNNRPIMDVNLSSPGAFALSVNDDGGVFKYDLGTLSMTTIRSNMLSDDRSWKLALTSTHDGCYVASSSTVKQLDFRADGAVLDLYNPLRVQSTHTKSSKGLPELLTHIEPARNDNLVRLLSTQELMWIDVRFPKRPLLGYMHGRDWDRTLKSHTVLFPEPATFLTSRNNGLVTVYDVSKADERGIEINDSPYELPPSPIKRANGGAAFFRATSDKKQEGISIFHLGEKGEVYRRNLVIPGSQRGDVAFPDCTWSPELEELASKASNSRVEVGPLGKRDLVMEVDLSEAYRAIYDVDTEPPLESTEQAYDTLDRMPRFWQESEVPLEHMMTTFDVAFRSGEEPSPTQASRADFFTQSSMSSVRGVRALTQGRLASTVEEIKKEAAWSWNTTRTLQKSIPELQGPNENLNPASLIASLSSLNKYGTTPASIRREQGAAEQLAVDLALSQDVFSPVSISEANTELEDAAGAMSLGDEPPPIRFGFLRPVLPDADEAGKEQKTGIDTPLGVRLLLQEWGPDSSPSQYVYRDPYDDSLTTPRPRPTRKPQAQSQDASGPAPPTLVSQKPPVLATQKVKATGLVRTMSQPQQIPAFVAAVRPFGSQVAEVEGLQSQESMVPMVPMANTQVLPGPYGGRQQAGAAGKKKVVKKRMGGF